MNDIIKGYLELNKDQWVPLNTFILSKYIADLFKNKESLNNDTLELIYSLLYDIDTIQNGCEMFVINLGKIIINNDNNHEAIYNFIKICSPNYDKYVTNMILYLININYNFDIENIFNLGLLYNSDVACLFMENT